MAEDVWGADALQDSCTVQAVRYLLADRDFPDPQNLLYHMAHVAHNNYLSESFFSESAYSLSAAN